MFIEKVICSEEGCNMLCHRIIDLSVFLCARSGEGR